MIHNSPNHNKVVRGKKAFGKILNMSVIDDYLEEINILQRTELERIRRIVIQRVPDAEEVISYGMPAFKYNGKYLIGFAVFKNHLSLFPTAGPIEALKERLNGFKLSKGTIQFTVDNHISEPMIKKIIDIRIANIEGP